MDLGECKKERWWTRGRRAAQLAEDRGRRRAGDSGGGGERRAGEAERKRSVGSGFFLFPTCSAKQEELSERLRREKWGAEAFGNAPRLLTWSGRNATKEAPR